MTMWKEKSISFGSIEYEEKAFFRTPLPKYFAILNGHYRIVGAKKLPTRCAYAYEPLEHYYKKWESMCETLVKGIMWEKFPEYKRFGISLAGIKAGKEEISIDPKKLEPNVFYLFSYKDEKYVARKSDDDVIEIYEVME